jgi:hypothetical protein
LSRALLMRVFGVVSMVKGRVARDNL